MGEKGLQEISKQSRELYEKGKSALDRENWDYAIAIFNQVLQTEPGFYACREALRAAQFKKAGSRGGFFRKVLGSASSSSHVAKGQYLLRNRPLEAISVAEGLLNSNPNNTAAHRLLAEAALEADLPKTAVLSLEIAAKNSPDDRDIALALGDALTRAGQVVRAESILSDLQRAHPKDNEVAQALKDVSARRTMQEGGYEGLSEGGGSYREILRDEAEAVSLEQDQRQTKTAEAAANMIQTLESRLESNPNHLKTLRSLAELHEQRGELDRALEYYERMISGEGGSDPAIEKAVTEVKLKKIDRAIAELPEDAADREERASALRAEREALELSAAQRRSERYPNDLQIRFELAEVYFRAGKLSEAIREYQRAQSNPHLKTRALLRLGDCFSRRGMNDMAVRALESALKEKAVFDDEKKELHYLLGTVFQKLGRSDDAVEQFKLIYEVDIGYRDVAEKVDAYYGAQQ